MVILKYWLRVVLRVAAYGQAVNLAKEIVKFPQECLRCDRRSAFNATFRSDHGAAT
jgi:hypothetical protein